MRRWLVLREGSRLRWGGDLRRRFIYDGFAALPSAVVLEDRRAAVLRRSVREIVGRRWFTWRRPRLASTELLSDAQLRAIEAWVVPTVVDVHDEPVMQADALGVPFAPADRAAVHERLRRNLDWFPLWTTPSAALAELAGLDPDRVVVAPNGSRTDIVEPAPWPSEPALTFASGAAPRRGIEQLLEATRLVRAVVPETRLHLLLAATDPQSAAYLEALTTAVADDPSVSIGTTPYDELGSAVGRAWVYVIPTPAHPYWDAVAPIKLFDAMAAGRPIVTTPRRAIAEVVEREGVGIVADGDRPEDLAEAILALLRDPQRARTLGEAARRAAVERHDWRAIAAATAAQVADRLGAGGRQRLLLRRRHR
jgi:glycosyltransferase involved in cell wall biosynthesis